MDKNQLPDDQFILCQPYGFIPDGGHEFVTQAVIDEIRECGNLLKSLANEFNAVYVPFFDVMEEKIKESGCAYYLRDAVHPTHAGHVLLANIWLETVTKALA